MSNNAEAALGLKRLAKQLVADKSSYTLHSVKRNPWTNRELVDEYAELFRNAGFSHVGLFRVDELKLRQGSSHESHLAYRETCRPRSVA